MLADHGVPLICCDKEKNMLEFIKKYRNSPCRTVVTFKLNECVCLNKLGELNQARRAKNEYGNTQNDSENEKKQIKDEKNKAKRAFREQENSVSLDSMGKENSSDECKCGCDEEMCIGDNGRSDCFCLPCARADVRGGINSEKTVRVLLCDLVAGAMLMGGAMCAKMLILRLK